MLSSGRGPLCCSCLPKLFGAAIGLQSPGWERQPPALGLKRLALGLSRLPPPSREARGGWEAVLGQKLLLLLQPVCRCQSWPLSSPYVKKGRNTKMAQGFGAFFQSTIFFNWAPVNNSFFTCNGFFQRQEKLEISVIISFLWCFVTWRKFCYNTYRETV